MSDEIPLHVARAYFKDRVKELRNQLPNGDPFVFIGALVLLNSVAMHAGRSGASLLPVEYDPDKALLARTMEQLPTFFARFMDGPREVPDGTESHKLAFTHVNDIHLQRVNHNGFIKHVIAAEPFLNSIDKAIDDLFDAAKEDQILAVELWLSFQKRRLFGYGK